MLATFGPTKTTPTADVNKAVAMAASYPPMMDWPLLAFALPATSTMPAYALVSDPDLQRSFRVEITLFQGHHIVVVPHSLLLPLRTLSVEQQCICLRLMQTSPTLTPWHFCQEVCLGFPESLSNRIRWVVPLVLSVGRSVSKSEGTGTEDTLEVSEDRVKHAKATNTSKTPTTWETPPCSRFTLTLRAMDELQMHRTCGRARRIREHLPVSAVLTDTTVPREVATSTTSATSETTKEPPSRSTSCCVRLQLVNGQVLERLWPHGSSTCAILRLDDKVCLQDLRNARLSLVEVPNASQTQSVSPHLAIPDVHDMDTDKNTNKNTNIATVSPTGSHIECLDNGCYYQQVFHVGVYFQQVQAMLAGTQRAAVMPVSTSMLQRTVTIRAGDGYRGSLLEALETDWPVLSLDETGDDKLPTLPCHSRRYKWCVVQTSTETRGLALRRCAPYNDAPALVYVDLCVPGTNLRFAAWWQTNQMLTLPLYLSAGKEKGLGFPNGTKSLQVTFTYHANIDAARSSMQRFLAPSVWTTLVSSFRRPLVVWASIRPRTTQARWGHEDLGNVKMTHVHPIRLMIGLALVPSHANRDETYYAITLKLPPREPGVVRDNKATQLVQECRQAVRLVVTAHTPEMLFLRRRWPPAVAQLWLPRRGMSEERIVDFLQMLLSHDATTRSYNPGVHFGLLLHIVTP